MLKYILDMHLHILTCLQVCVRFLLLALLFGVLLFCRGPAPEVYLLTHVLYIL